MLAPRNEEKNMPKADTAVIERITARTINETARGDPDALASRIVAGLAEAGYHIDQANGMEDTALGSQRSQQSRIAAESKLLYRSPNGDTWSLAHDPATGLAFVRHQANAPSGGQVTNLEIGDFLSGSQHPEQAALLRLIGTLMQGGSAWGCPAGLGHSSMGRCRACAGRAFRPRLEGPRMVL
jgi:hypothetical protein